MDEAALTRTLPAQRDLRGWLGDRGVYLALALLVAFNLAFTANFATVGNLRLQLIQVVPVAIVALGMALVIGTEGIDLSVGATMAIAAALLPLYLGYGPWVAIPIALAAGGVVGLVNGGLVAFVGVQPIVATLGLLVAGRGSGLLAALAGILDTARLSAADPSFVGLLIELSAITAVVVGGTPLSGGRVRIVGTLAGALLMQLIAATLIKHDLPDSTARMIAAAIIVAAVYLQRTRVAT